MPTPRPCLIEACVTSLEEALSAEHAGAHRLELCRDLDTGGLTPHLDVVAAVVARVTVPVFAMVRPQEGAFQAEPADVVAMLRDVASLSAAGVDGFVLGLLHGDGGIDLPAVQELVAAAGDRPVTFHRAFDSVVDPLSALDALAGAGVSRVLTSGGPPTAREGSTTLRELVRRAGDKVIMIGGGGIRGDHVRRLLEHTGLGEVHARASAVPGLVAALWT